MKWVTRTWVLLLGMIVGAVLVVAGVAFASGGMSRTSQGGPTRDHGVEGVSIARILAWLPVELRAHVQEDHTFRDAKALIGHLRSEHAGQLPVIGPEGSGGRGGMEHGDLGDFKSRDNQ